MNTDGQFEAIDERGPR